MITLLLIIAVAAAVFVFVKNNPKKTAQIDQAAKSVAEKIKDQIKK